MANVAGGRPIWITEAGWPVAGKTSNLAIASVDNAETFWQDVSCELQRRNVDFWWYILADGGASPSFGVSENGKPLYDLSCKEPSKSNSTSTSSSSSHSTSTSGSHSSSGTQGASTSHSSGAAATGSSSGGTNSGSTTQGAGSTTLATTAANGGASSTSSSGPSTFTAGASRMSGSVVGAAAGVILAALAL